jgi:hypothetical protein
MAKHFLKIGQNIAKKPITNSLQSLINHIKPLILKKYPLVIKLAKNIPKIGKKSKKSRLHGQKLFFSYMLFFVTY